MFVINIFIDLGFTFSSINRGVYRMPAKYSQNDFLKKAKKIHGNKYDYSKVIYIGATQKVLIKCNQCNKEFLQNAHSHLRGAGCPFCADKENSERFSHTKEKFIEKAKDIHGDNYNYDQVNYKRSNQKVKILCKKCGNYFEQTPAHHLNGSGCPQCSHKMSTSKFIEKAKKIYGDKYNYDQVVYKGSEYKVKIYCNICKKYFEQTPHVHLKGKGCKYCNILKNTIRQTTPLKEFVKKAKSVHGDIYDYTQTTYKNSKTSIKIRCKRCNAVFSQNPQKHLSGQGCPFCRGSSGEKIISGWLSSNNIKFIYQKWFVDCRDILPLPFDFYLPDYNTCIEFQGKQHYSPQMFIALYKSQEEGIKKFNQQVYHDKIKKEYCKTQNIPLIVIKYDEDISDKLNSYFYHHNS